MALVQWTLKNVKFALEGAQNNEFDNIVMIEGNRGVGKSTLAYKLSKKLKIKSPFKPRRDIVYSREDVIRALANSRHGIIFADEMINVTYKRDFFEADQKKLIKALNMYRDSCNTFICCVPRFSSLDTDMQELCKLRFVVVSRGIAIIHMPLTTTFTKDKWDIYRNMKIESKWGKRGIAHPKYAQLTTAVGWLKFGDLPTKQKRIYKKLKSIKRNKIFQGYEEEDFGLEGADKDKRVMDRIFQKVVEKKLDKQEFYNLCFFMNKKENTMRGKITEMLRNKGYDGTFRDYVTKDNSIKKGIDIGFKKI